jgi:CheY-like chemotaxis protein
VIDDDPTGLELRRLVLEHVGHHVRIAACVNEARIEFRGTALDTALPDAVLMDLRLPGIEDGLALLRDFRQASPAVRIVVLSGYAEDLAGCAERALADAILCKPVRTERLLDALISARP